MDSSAIVKGDFKENVALSRAINHLGISLYKILTKEGGNVFFSPLSLSNAMAMVFCGARHETAQEMRSVLGYEVSGIPDEEVHHHFRRLVSSLDKSPEYYTLNNANVAFAQRDFDVREEYKSILNDSFNALMLDVDFAHETERALLEANNWVKEKTNGMIPQILESLNPATVMVILNAVYFKGLWSSQFKEKDTFLQYFYNNGLEDNAKHVEMMHLKEKFPFVEKESFKSIQLPYKGGDLAMLIFLPNSRDGLDQLESHLTADFIASVKSELREMKVEVALPKFRMEYSKSMQDHFKSLGISRIFSGGADFGIISQSEQLLVSEIIHKAVIEVNEEGTEAAAATAVVMLRCLTFCPEIVVDHPFIFLLYNLKNDMTLFVGKVEEL